MRFVEGVIELPCLPGRLAGALAVRLAGRATGKSAGTVQAQPPGLALPSGIVVPPGPLVTPKPLEPAQARKSLEPLEASEKRHGALAGLAADPVAELAH